MTGGCTDRGESEGNAPIKNGDGALPRDGKFADDPAVLFRPVALTVRGSAVITDGLGNLQVFGRHRPETAKGRKGRRGARHVMLAYETDGEQDPASVARRGQTL